MLRTFFLKNDFLSLARLEPEMLEAVSLHVNHKSFIELKELNGTVILICLKGGGEGGESAAKTS